MKGATVGGGGGRPKGGAGAGGDPAPLAASEPQHTIVDKAGEETARSGGYLDRVPPIPHPSRIGPYTLLEPIGKGATAQVFRARDDRDGRQVAFKLITDLDRDANDRFVAEVAALRRVSHPGVVEIYDSGVADTGRWLAMELVEGRPLDEWVEIVTGGTRLRRILRAGEQIAWALAALHDQRIIHRDLKPANVLVGKGGRVVLVDFGFAAHLDRPEETGAAGTLRYMAPERLTGASTDYRSDLFSLGVVLFELIARRAPHVGTDQHRLILAQCTEPAPSIAEFTPEAPPAAIETIDRLLAKPVAERPRHATEVALALRSALGQSPRTSTWRPSVRGTPFVGHAPLMARLLALGRGKAPSTIILHGPHQVGLTRMLTEIQGRLMVKGVLALLAAGGPRVLSTLLDGLCGPHLPSDQRLARMGTERDLLLAAWPDLARPTEELVALTRVPTPSDLMAAVRQVFRRAADQQHIAILIDDAERCDPRDLGLIEGFGLLLLSTHEPAQLRFPGERELVPRLDSVQMAELARLLLGRAIGPPMAADHEAEIAGLPGHLVRLARGVGSDAANARVERTVARVRPWPNAIDEAERLLVQQGPRAALAVLEETGTGRPSPELRHRLALLRSRLALQRGELTEAAEHAHDALEQAAPGQEEAEARLALVTVMLSEGRAREVIEVGTATSRAASAAGAHNLAIRWGVLTARACHHEGRFNHARELLETLVSAGDADEPPPLGLVWTLIEVSVQQCDWTRARTLIQTTVEDGRAPTGRRGRGGLRLEVGKFWLRRGEVTKANDQFERAWQDVSRAEDHRLLATLLAQFAEGRLMGGRVDEAGRLAREAMTEAALTHDRTIQSEALRVALRQARLAGDFSRLAELIPLARQTVEASPDGLWADALAAQLALALVSTGAADEAHRLLPRIGATSGEDPHLRAVAELTCLSIHRARGENPWQQAGQLARRLHNESMLHLSGIATALAVHGRPAAARTRAAEREALQRGDRIAAAWLEQVRVDNKATSARIRSAGLLGLLGPLALAP